MNRQERRLLILQLIQQGLSNRQISKTLKVSRKTIRKAVREAGKQTESAQAEHLGLIREVFGNCNGNAVRVLEVLREDHGLSLGYSTLTRLLREHEIREAKTPVGSYHYKPGQEMQFDTSPHRVVLGERTQTLQCASLVLAHSRFLFALYYPRFTRFEAKWFLSAAFSEIGGLCRHCMIDNTNIVLAGGSGADAIICAEMSDFSRMWGFAFIAHNLGHPERKAPCERMFHYIENNFLAGRTFKDLSDLNRQLTQWCAQTANIKEKRSLKMSPQTALTAERPYLKALPPHLPPVYVSSTRLVDARGYINLETNRYSVPQRYICKRVLVHKYPEQVRIYFDGKLIAEHPRFLERCRGQHTVRGHHEFKSREKARAVNSALEHELCGQHELLSRYVVQLKTRAPGRGTTRLKHLHKLWQTYPSEAFYPALEKALHYGLYDLKRLEGLILTFIAGDFFQLPGDEPCD